mgnify:CR=1 FL=1
MLDYERRDAENFEREHASMKRRVDDGTPRLSYIRVIDRELFLIGCRISWLQASQAQLWAESRTLYRTIRFERTELRESASRFGEEISLLVEIQEKFQELKDELLNHYITRAMKGNWN